MANTRPAKSRPAKTAPAKSARGSGLTLFGVLTVVTIVLLMAMQSLKLASGQPGAETAGAKHRQGAKQGTDKDAPPPIPSIDRNG